MAFVRIFDGSGEVESVVFPTTFAQNKQILEKETVVLIHGKVDKREEGFSLIVDNIEVFDPQAALKLELPEVEVEIPAGADGALLQKVNTTLRKYPGAAPIAILIPNGNNFRKMSLGFTVEPSGELKTNLEEILGPNSIRLN